MGKLQQERDRQSDALDHRSSFAQQTDGQYSEVRDFLMEGLDHKVVSWWCYVIVYEYLYDDDVIVDKYLDDDDDDDDVSQTKDLSRKANLLRNRPSSGSIGIVLEDLLNAKGQKFSFNTKKKKGSKLRGIGEDDEDVGANNPNKKSREKDRVSTAGSAMSGSGGGGGGGGGGGYKASSSMKGSSISMQTDD